MFPYKSLASGRLIFGIKLMVIIKPMDFYYICYK